MVIVRNSVIGGLSGVHLLRFADYCQLFIAFIACYQCYQSDNNFYPPKANCLEILKVKFDEKVHRYRYMTIFYR